MRVLYDGSEEEGQALSQSVLNWNLRHGKFRDSVEFQFESRERKYENSRCDGCGGRMRILAAIERPHTIREILDCLGLPSRPPPIAPALPDSDIDRLYFS